MISNHTTYPLLKEKEIDKIKRLLREVYLLTKETKKYREQNNELKARLEYLADSTSPNGQWADQAVCNFVKFCLKTNFN